MAVFYIHFGEFTINKAGFSSYFMVSFNRNNDTRRPSEWMIPMIFKLGCESIDVI